MEMVDSGMKSSDLLMMTNNDGNDSSIITIDSGTIMSYI